MRLCGAAHAVDDLYQGLVPACVPYLVLNRHYGYVAASGLALAATLGSSLPQPIIGIAVDMLRLSWLPAFAVFGGIALNLPFSVLVKLGQDYRPARPGTAAGVTLGPGVSIGGLAAQLLGMVANAYGPQGVLSVFCLLPPLTLLLGLFLPEPDPA